VLPANGSFLTLDPPQRRQRTLAELKRVLLRESQVQPLLLVFEDLHWIDAEPQAMLDSLVESLPTAYILLLVNYRPEYQHRWGSKTSYKAKRLLAEAGHARGLDVELIVRRGPLYERPALSRQDDLKKVGVTIKITLLDTAGMRDRQEKGDFQVFELLAAVQLDDPDFYYARFTCGAPSNDGKYCNPEFDKLFAEQSRTFDVQQRAEITRQMERILLHDIPDARGFFWKSAMGYWNRVQQWPPLQETTVYNFGKFEQVWCQGGRCM
jgi:ABC-type transport system substrate-binding protein